LLATFADADADGFGAGAGTSRCVGTFPPAGTAFVSGDCAVNDPALFAELPYSLDQDNDGHVSAALGTVCTGGALPPGLLSLGSAAQDCDDQDAVSWRNVAIYQDRDGDGVGSGAFAVTCMGDLVPAGYSGLGYDPLDVPGDPDSLHLSNLELDVAILIVP
jgi:hypothetical protein